MCFLVAKLIRRNLFYSSEKVLKLTLSNVEIKKKFRGYTPGLPLQGEGGKRSRGEEVGGRGWEGRKCVGKGEGRELRGWEEERRSYTIPNPL